MQEITTTFNSRWGDYNVTIQGVKARKCDQCDELVYSNEEARMIQNITAGFADSQVKDKPDLINLQETAELLRASNQTMYNMLKDGRLSARKIGKEWRFIKDEVYVVMMGKSKRTIQNQSEI